MNAQLPIDDIERLLFDVVKALFAQDTQVTGLLDLPVAQLRVLNVLGRETSERRLTMGELAEALGIALSTATQIVERIVQRGLVQRTHGDPNDRRIVRLALTEQGQELLDNRRRLRRTRLALMLAHLDSGEQDTIINALEPLALAARGLTVNGERTAQADIALLPGLREVA